MYWKFIITGELVDTTNVNLQHLHFKYYEQKKVHSVNRKKKVCQVLLGGYVCVFVW